MTVGVPSSDELAITQRLHHLLTQCCRGLDRGDAQLLRDCFHADADLPPADAVAGGQHAVTNVHLLGINGDVAATETYWVWRRAGQDGQLEQSLGRWLDRFERRAGQWRIARRTVITEWPAAETVDHGPDPSYALAAEVEPEGPHVGRARVDGVVA